jgi:hypothetical protein
MTYLASTDLERSRGWIAQAATGMWSSAQRAELLRLDGNEDGAAAARVLFVQYDTALTLAVLRYLGALRAT